MCALFQNTLNVFLFQDSTHSTPLWQHENNCLNFFCKFLKNKKQKHITCTYVSTAFDKAFDKVQGIVCRPRTWLYQGTDLEKGVEKWRLLMSTVASIICNCKKFGTTRTLPSLHRSRKAFSQGGDQEPDNQTLQSSSSTRTDENLPEWTITPQ